VARWRVSGDDVGNDPGSVGETRVWVVWEKVGLMSVETWAVRGVARRGLTRRTARQAVAGTALIMAAATACTGGGGGSNNNPAASGPGSVVAGESSTAPSPTAPPAPPAQLTITPKTGSSGLSPKAPIKVTAAGGTIQGVRLENADGKPVKGTTAADGSSWTASEPLGYDKSYTLTATAANADGKKTTAHSSFRTVTPGNFTMPSFGALEGGGTFGTAMPITLHFDEPITNRAAAEKALSVTTTPKVTGSWYWIDNQNVHYRGKAYWKAGTKITVAAHLYGVNLGNGLYGQADKAVSFTIGRSQTAVINDATHTMIVYINGKKARTIPVSMGRGGSIVVNGRTISFWTQSGVHVVLEKHAVKHMDSSSYGLPVDSPLGYSEDIPLATRISASGEFIHAASWSVGDQGVRNVSHGCVNISPANAQWFYNTFRYGDPVDIRGTGHPLPLTDGLGDWNLSWTQWRQGSALH
jgi:lipoprotein-anchoring transpeptidase ErfK/SrfK